MTLAIPTIHLNGTSRETLVNDLCDALEALSKAITAVAKTCPNGRDYYVQGPDAIQEALRQHANRLHNLTAVKNELNEIAEELAYRAPQRR